MLSRGIQTIAIVAVLGMGNLFASGICMPKKCEEPICEEKKPCCTIPIRNHCFWIEPDFIGWTAFEGGFNCDFGTTTIDTTTASGVTTTTITETNCNIPFGWHVGYRVDVGYNFCNIADANLKATYLSGHTKVTNGSNTFKWKLQFITVDALLACTFGKTCCTVRPFTGTKFADIIQKAKIATETTLTSTSGTSTVTTNNNDKQSFIGLGPEFGLQADWFFACGLDMYAIADGALLYGKVKTTFNDTSASTVTERICNATSKSGICQAAIDLASGVRWNCDCLVIDVGVEHHRYSNFNQIACNGDLNIFGAHVGVVFIY